VRAGYFARACRPHRIQRYRCRHCGRYFSDQTFRTSYWLKRPELLQLIFHRLLACSAYRQISRELDVSPQTVLGQTVRLGQHCLLFHQCSRSRGPIREPVALDSFQSFEYSQDHPTLYHLLAGRMTHYCYGFTESELRRSGRMTHAQRLRRARVEALYGRPDPRSVERDVAALLDMVAPAPQSLELATDQHTDYPKALRRVPHLQVVHETISSRAARTPRNPLFDVNLLDGLLRHSCANHKRETLAFSKRRQSSIERLWVFLVWRNWIKSFSERRRDASPAMRLGLIERRITSTDVLRRRLFPTRESLPERWARYYGREITTRRVPNGVRHRRVFAI
jgi:hypothetical protein